MIDGDCLCERNFYEYSKIELYKRIFDLFFRLYLDTIWKERKCVKE